MTNLFLNIINEKFLLWLLLVPIALIFLLVIVALVVRIIKMQKLHQVSKGVKIIDDEQQQFYDAYGGRDNIVSISNELSRITVEVVDLDLVNTEGLKDLGATGVLVTGKNIKASFGENATNIFKKIKLK